VAAGARPSRKDDGGRGEAIFSVCQTDRPSRVRPDRYRARWTCESGEAVSTARWHIQPRRYSVYVNRLARCLLAAHSRWWGCRRGVVRLGDQWSSDPAGRESIYCWTDIYGSQRLRVVRVSAAALPKPPMTDGAKGWHGGRFRLHGRAPPSARPDGADLAALRLGAVRKQVYRADDRRPDGGGIEAGPATLHAAPEERTRHWLVSEQAHSQGHGGGSDLSELPGHCEGWLFGRLPCVRQTAGGGLVPAARPREFTGLPTSVDACGRES